MNSYITPIYLGKGVEECRQVCLSEKFILEDLNLSCKMCLAFGLLLSSAVTLSDHTPMDINAKPFGKCFCSILDKFGLYNNFLLLQQMSMGKLNKSVLSECFSI